jgi:ribose-phosphate pyrophosphokinase
LSNIAIHSLPSAALDASRLASRLRIPMHQIGLHRFPDGELRVTVGATASTAILYVPLDQPNEKIVSVLFATEALRRNGAERVVLVAPYLCYMRQDAAFQEGEAISQKVIGHLFAGIFDRIVTVDAHLHRTTRLRSVFPNVPADNLSAIPAIARVLQTTGIDPRTVVVGPDVESLPWVRDLAGRLGLVHTVAQKTRRGDRSVEIQFAEQHLFEGQPVLLFDDIVSSGGTLVTCAKALVAAGATSVDVVVTHALFPPELVADFLNSGIRSIRSTHSVPHPTNAIPLDDIIATALCDETEISIGLEKSS